MSNFYSYAEANAESVTAVIEAARPFAGGSLTAPQGLHGAQSESQREGGCIKVA
jgi:hypothetical protein